MKFACSNVWTYLKFPTPSYIYVHIFLFSLVYTWSLLLFLTLLFSVTVVWGITICSIDSTDKLISVMFIPGTFMSVLNWKIISVAGQTNYLIVRSNDEQYNLHSNSAQRTPYKLIQSGKNTASSSCLTLSQAARLFRSEKWENLGMFRPTTKLSSLLLY